MRSIRLAIAAMVTLVVGGCASARTVLVGETTRRTRAPRLSSNQRAARRDAAALLRSLRLPAGAAYRSREPRGDHRALKPLTAIVGSTARADAHAWWSVPGEPTSVLGYIEAHPPAGGSRFETGSGGGRSGTTEWDVGYRWPSVPGVLTARVLQVTVTTLPGGDTGVLAQAQSDWYVPRPTGERVPAGVRTVELTAGPVGKPPTLRRDLTSIARVRRTITMVDAMPVVQPDVLSCPAQITSGGRVITLEFDGRGSQPLAEARYLDFPPLSASSGECTPVDFSVHGHRQTPLLGGTFVPRLERIAGVTLAG